MAEIARAWRPALACSLCLGLVALEANAANERALVCYTHRHVNPTPEHFIRGHISPSSEAQSTTLPVALVHSFKFYILQTAGIRPRDFARLGTPSTYNLLLYHSEAMVVLFNRKKRI